MSAETGDPSLNPKQTPERKPIWKRLSIPWKKPVKITESQMPTLSEFQIPPDLDQILTPTPDQEIEAAVVEQSRQTGIGELFLATLKQKGLIIESEEFKAIGQPAMESTNETGDPTLFEKLRNHEQSLNGYLIGIGAANIFSMLEAFPEGTVPKGIILFDLDPKVVKFGQDLIEGLKESPDNLPFSLDRWEQQRDVFYTIGQAQPKVAIHKYAHVLHQLAKEGNLIMVRADFTNPQIGTELANLPGLKESNNLIYLSNIADHINRRNYTKLPDFSPLQQLSPESPHKNYYVDTLTFPLSYHLRVGTSIPQFNYGDFNGLDRFQTRETDLIDRQEDNIVWRDLTNLEVTGLIQSAQEITSRPIYTNKRDSTTRSINEMREYEISKIPELKKIAATPVEQRADHQKNWIIELPSSPDEEARLIRELEAPYDYDRDYLPFIARYIWRDASSPAQWNDLPRRDNYFMDPETRKIRFIQNLNQWTKGKVELWQIEAGVTYEELAMAKIYREVEKRLKAKKPEFDTNGKSFDELIAGLEAA